MDLSDSTTVRYPETWLREAFAAWSLIAVQSAADAAARRSSEDTRSLQALMGHLEAQSQPQPWQSLAAAIYRGFAEASGNRFYEAQLDDLWQILLGDRRWDPAATMWEFRRYAEESLRSVIAAIAQSAPARTRAAMEIHIATIARLVTS